MLTYPVSEAAIPRQRGSEARCHRCGATEVNLAPDGEMPGKQRCVDVWNGCFKAWQPHCPSWCTSRHHPEDDKPFRERVWFHHSNGIEVTTGDSDRLLGSISIDLCAFERVGGGLETPTVMI